MHQSSMYKMSVFKQKYLEEKKDKPLLILDIGSLDVNGTYRQYFDFYPWIYRGVDMSAGENVDIVLQNPYNWREIKSDSADVLISGQAFEHIEYFWITILEMARVLKPGGLCCIIAPSGGFEHKYPVDCWRFYPDGFSALARFARLDIIEVSTQWEPDPQFKDDSNTWSDSILICKKPYGSGINLWKEKLMRWFLHRLLLLYI